MSLMRHDLADDAVPTEVDGVVSWPDDTEFANVRNNCCGSPYPIAVLPSGAEFCTGCLHDVAPTVEAERALDEDADMYHDADDEAHAYYENGQWHE